MFIRRADYLTLVRELTAERSKREILARELAIRQQNIDWLTGHVNRLEFERSELTQRVLGMTLPYPVIAREAADHPELTQALGMGTPLRERDRPDTESEGVAGAQLGLASFEDMGDEMAARLHVAHDDNGHVKFS